MKVWAMALVLAATVGANAQGIKEKKERAGIDAQLTEVIKPANTACGAHAKMVYDWKSIDSYKWDSPEAKATWLGQQHSGNVGGAVAAMEELCKDKDYKAALAKTSTVTVKLVKTGDRDVKKAGSGLVWEMDPARGMADMDKEALAEKIKGVLN